MGSLEQRTPDTNAQGRLRARVPLWILIQVGCVGLMTVPAWFLGAVQVEPQFWLFVVGACVMLGCWGICLGRTVSVRPLPVVLVPLALTLVMVALQTIPMPAAVHRWVSPSTLRWWQDLTPQATTVSESADIAWYPVSLYPASTQRELYLLSLAVAGFVLGAMVLADRVAFSIAGVAVAINGAVLAFFGLVQQLTWNGLLFWSIPLTHGGAPFASYVNRNNAAGFLNICLACGIALSVWGLVHAAYHSKRRAQVGQNSFRPIQNVERNSFRPSRMNSILQSCVRAARTLVTMPLLILAHLNAATLLGLVVAGCIAAGILCSLSRGASIGMLGAATITLLAAALAGRWQRGWLGPILVAGVAACLLVNHVGMSERVSERMSTVLDKSVRESDGRLVNWADGWVAAKDLLPVGSGLGTYRYVYRAYQQQLNTAWFYHAENVYLQALVEAGLPGLGLLLATLGLVALACWRLLQRAPDAATYALGVAGTYALSSQAIHAMFDFGLYLPANMLLLAVLCGAVCGRAARLESPGWRWPAILVALPPLRPLAASCCIALTGLLLLGGGEAHRAVAVEAALAEAKPLDLKGPQPIAVLDRCLNRCAVSASGADDVESQLKVARLWTSRMRAGLVEVIRDEVADGTSESVLWSATDPVYLHGRMQQWTAQQRTVEVAALRRSPPVMENVPQAIRHLQQARRACPLVPEIHMMLAQLTILTAENADNQADLQRVRLTAPGQPEILTRCGLLELQSGHIARACECWQASLKLAPGQLPEILQVARPSFDLTTHIGELVPASPEWILDVALAQFSAPADQPVRRALLAKAESLVSNPVGDDAQASWLRGRIALLRNNAQGAVSYFTQALAMRPDETAWRYELAIALKQSGRYPEAQEQALVCVRTEPDNERYEALLREVIRTQLAPKRRSETDTQASGLTSTPTASRGW